MSLGQDQNPPGALRAVAASLASIDNAVRRIADRLSPPPQPIVGSGYVAARLGCTLTWVAAMARSGEIPTDCVVPGSGGGKVWRFYREAIDRWTSAR